MASTCREASPLSSADAPALDEKRQAIVERFVAGLGDDVVGSHVVPGDDVWVRVRASAWLRAGEIAHSELGCTYFCFLSALDWLPSPYGRSEDDPTEPPVERSTAIVQGYAGGDTRFQVFARVSSPTEHFGVTLKADVPDDLRIRSWTSIYSGANWHERETWEMFGIVFDGHPQLTHIYLPSEFEGYPLRKDYPLLARMVKPWPGIVDVEPLPGGDDEGESE